MTIEAIIFDLDGTFYSNKSLKRSLITSRLIFNRYFFKVQSIRKKVNLLNQRTKKHLPIDQLPEYLNSDGLNIISGLLNSKSPHRAKNWYVSQFYPAFLKALNPSLTFTNCFSVLQFIQSKSIKMAVVSDYHYINERLERLSINPNHFNLCHSAEHSGFLKPDPHSFKQVLHYLNVQPEKCLIVGDRLDMDAKAAKALNCPFFHLTKNEDWLELQNFITQKCS